MPPCVRMKPPSTVMLPGPTCFQPVRSLPLKRGFQAGSCGGAAAKENRVDAAATDSIVTHLRGGMAWCSSEKSRLAGVQHAAPLQGKIKTASCEDSRN